LNDREGGEFQFDEETYLSSCTIAAKFLTKRVLNTEAIIRTSNPIWRSKNGFKVRNVRNNILLFVFDNEEVEKIFDGELWCFDKHLVMIQRYDHSIPVKDLVFDKALLWVLVHDIPIKFLSQDVVEKLCEAIGEVKRKVSQKEVEWGKVMRIRVWVNVNLPLCYGRVFTRKNGVKGWVSFKYECPPNMCYWCGCLNHFDKDYEC